MRPTDTRRGLVQLVLSVMQGVIHETVRDAEGNVLSAARTRAPTTHNG